MKYDRLKNKTTRLLLSLMTKKSQFKAVQTALNNMGRHLVVDGDIGNITINAIKSVNNKRLHRELYYILYEGKKPLKQHKNPRWLKIAINEIGTKEYAGKASNKAVERYHDAAGIGWATDDVPWCGSFVAFVMIKAGYKPPKNPARAKSWLKFGKSAHRPVVGAIAVKSRKGGGHVTFVVGKSNDGRYLYCVGGNQSDAVNVRRYKTNVFLDFRVPIDYNGTALPLYAGIAKSAGREA